MITRSARVGCDKEICQSGCEIEICKSDCDNEIFKIDCDHEFCKNGVKTRSARAVVITVFSHMSRYMMLIDGKDEVYFADRDNCIFHVKVGHYAVLSNSVCSTRVPDFDAKIMLILFPFPRK